MQLGRSVVGNSIQTSQLEIPWICACVNGLAPAFFWQSPLRFMERHLPADIRNFAIVGHASSGKTMLAEAMLACSGVIGRMGRIADGTTVSDYHVSEKQRQISTQASLLHTEWLGKKLNFIDTPGSVSYTHLTLPT